MASMPAGHWGNDIGANGAYEAVVAPSAGNAIYLCVNGYVYSSTDGGTTFTLTALAKIAAAHNDDYRAYGPKMAVHPQNPAILIVGAQSGPIWKTADSGKTWSALPVPSPTGPSGARTAFDGEILYVHSAGHGTFVSRDQGATFSALGGAPEARHIAASRGVLWLTDKAGSLQRFKEGRWSVVLSGSDAKTIAIDNDGRIAVGGFGGGTQWSVDGISWTPGQAGPMARTATDIPWLAWTNEAYMTSGGAAFDADGSYWYAEGIGVWRTILPQTGSFTWDSRSIGIEQMTSNGFLVPPSGSPLYLAWDRPIFKFDNLIQYPQRHGPNNISSIVCCWSADYAPQDSKTIVALINYFGREQSSISRDGGESWTKLPSMPQEIVAGGKIGGSIAVAGLENYVVVANNNGNVHFTKDGGKTWNPSVVPGAPFGADTGFGWAYYFHRHVITADKTEPGTFYLYNYNIGLMISRDGGATFSIVKSGQITDWSSFHAKLASVPGQSGHLLFTSGTQSGSTPARIPLMRSTDGGLSWNALGGAHEVHAFGFGAPATGRGYPSIFIAGYVNNVWGVYRSDDEGRTWHGLGANPLDIGDSVVAIAGDPNRHGRVFLAFGGSGAAWGDFVS